MKVAVRLDHAPFIGLGHLKRSLEIAEQLRNINIESIFLCRDHESSDYSFIEKQEFELIRLNPVVLTNEQASSTLSWLGVSQLEDAKEILSILEGKKVNGLMVDHYGVNDSWERIIREKYKLIVMDDLDRRHNADLLIDYSPWKSSINYENKVNEECKLLIGKDFIPVDQRFGEKVRGHKDFDLPRVLVSLGGSDRENLLEPIINSLSIIQKKLRSLIIVNSLLDEEKVKLLAKRLSIPYEIHVSPFGLKEIYECTDLCIGSSGISSIERCYFNIPSLVIVKAENQRRLAKYLSEKNLINCLHDFCDVEEEVIRFLEDKSRHREIHSQCLNFDISFGTKRIANQIESLLVEDVE